MRSRVWRVLINQQVADIKAKYGNYYYRNLCQSQGTAAEKQYINVHQKQINLDLLRTMPNNLHFMSATCKGVTQLQSILRAYCLHNPTLGYCQGMNFIAATALLFVSPEDGFWFLVAITEKLFDASYFDQSLTGAQADQEVLKEILERRYPRLAQHLEEHDIDLTTITLNWFLAIFFDAVPFQTMLRIWDIFLLEGSKILFRISIALLGLCEEEILARSDTISVIKVLKAAVKLTYDADG
uniref:Rab-GAP TBC domain-containing protein n=1 Tax=Panagrolaimus sp. ES5 TaxID=591445 RepID=A0AC34GDN1_9BILA